MLMLGFVCAARMTRRPIRPNPLIPTRIDMVFFGDLRVDSVLVAARYSVAAGASLEIFICEPPAHGLQLQNQYRSGADTLGRFNGPTSSHECKTQGPARCGNCRRLLDQRNAEVLG